MHETISPHFRLIVCFTHNQRSVNQKAGSSFFQMSSVHHQVDVDSELPRFQKQIIYIEHLGKALMIKVKIPFRFTNNFTFCEYAYFYDNLPLSSVPRKFL